MSGVASKRLDTVGSATPELPTCNVELATVDALSVGLSLQTLAARSLMPNETAMIYKRVGEQLEAAAKREIDQLRKARAK